MFFANKMLSLPDPATALPGRPDPIPTAEQHFITTNPLRGPFPDGHEKALFGMGCFWGAERKFWEFGEGIFITAVGYAAGYTPNPTYDEICTGQTGHNEVVLIVFDPTRISYGDLLKTFWENHDPTQGMRQGNDVGTQYRSGIYTFSPDQQRAGEETKATFEKILKSAGYKNITTEIISAPEFYYAEDYHQQYLAKVPNGYCGLGGTGQTCPLPTGINLTT